MFLISTLINSVLTILLTCNADIFLQMNDQLNSVLNRYESFKKGDFVAAANPVPSEYAGYVCLCSTLYQRD